MGFVVEAAAVTKIGLVRSTNEDAVLCGEWVSQGNQHVVAMREVSDSPVAFAVFDGMGGHAAGEVASFHAARRLAAASARISSADALALLLQSTNDDLYRMMQGSPESSGMGTTVAVVQVLSSSEVLVGNVGDSRVYRRVSDYLRQESVDHVPRPAVVGTDCDTAPSAVITQSLGGLAMHTPVEPAIRRLTLRTLPERFVICSDGVTDFVAIDDLERCSQLRDPVAVVRAISAATDATPCGDNYSVIVVDVWPDSDMRNPAGCTNSAASVGRGSETGTAAFCV